MKRIMLILLALLLCTGTACAEELYMEVEGPTETWADEDAAAGEDPAEGYINRLMYPTVPSGRKGLMKVNQSAGSRLTGLDGDRYAQLASWIRQIAAGEEVSTVYHFEPVTNTYTAEDLGVEAILVEVEPKKYKITSDAKNAAAALNPLPDLSSLMNALQADMPYDLYWYDKATGTSANISYSFNAYSEGSLADSVLECTSHLTISFAVSADYADTAGENLVNPAYGQRAQAAALNAEAILQEFAGLDDRTMLRRFMERICALTSYNDAAADDSTKPPYGDPWQLVWVFDGDETTTVVCEGYSKAFKYLVDRAETSAGAILASGYMNGGTGEGRHMWNIVSLDGGNWLVDVTNCDEGTIGAPDQLFLAGYDRMTDQGGYVYSVSSGREITYTYYDSTIATFGADSLRMSPNGHVHSWQVESRTAPTCTEPGWRVEVCADPACAERRTVVEAAGHDVSAAAWEGPWLCGVCPVCGERYVADVRDDGSVLELPADLQEIEAGAFEGTAAARVVIPEGCVRIGAGAFTACPNLISVTIPASVEFIGENAFDSRVVLISASAAAEAYAQEYGQPLAAPDHEHHIFVTARDFNLCKHCYQRLIGPTLGEPYQQSAGALQVPVLYGAGRALYLRVTLYQGGEPISVFMAPVLSDECTLNVAGADLAEIWLTPDISADDKTQFDAYGSMQSVTLISETPMPAAHSSTPEP